MKICPACYQPLNLVQYESFRILQCIGCQGYLLEQARLESIKRSTSKSPTTLKSEASTLFKGSTDKPLKCPRCRVPMEKQRLDLPVLNISADVCRQCSLVWLDPGELALIQLAFEASPEFQDAEEMKQRVRDMEANPERKAAFEDNLARLPEETPDSDPDPFVPAKRSILGLILRTLLRV